jgi:hypothetical protein
MSHYRWMDNKYFAYYWCKWNRTIVGCNIPFSLFKQRDDEVFFPVGWNCTRVQELQLISTIQGIAEKLKSGKDQIDFILLDFAKAFDKVPHKRLLHKLCHYGCHLFSHSSSADRSFWRSFESVWFLTCLYTKLSSANKRNVEVIKSWQNVNAAFALEDLANHS